MHRAKHFSAVFFALLLAVGGSGDLWAVDSILVEGLFSDVAVLQVDGKRYVLKKGKSTPEGIKLISANAREAILEHDGEQTVHPLGSRISGTYSKAERDQTRVRLWPDAAGMYRTIGSINGFTVRFLVDTGATLIAMNAKQAMRLGLNFRVDGTPSVASTASGFVKSYRIKLDRVKIGNIELRDVEAGVIDGDHPGDILLGMSFLGRLEMQRSNRKLELSTQPY